MIRNALVTSYRTIINNKTYTIINITGLVLGLTAAFVLLVFAINETSYNSFFTRKEQLYRAIYTDSKESKTPCGTKYIKSLLLGNVPELKNIARVVPELYITGHITLTSEHQTIPCRNLICADPEIFDMLDMNFTRGGIQGADKKPNILFISASVAKKYFNNTFRLYSPVILKAGNMDYEMVIGGIFNDLPWNSTIKADFIASLPFYQSMLKDLMPDFYSTFNSWDDFSVESICEFRQGTDIRSVSPRMQKILNDKAPKDLNLKISFQPFSDIYLGSGDMINNLHLSGNKISVYTYSWLALFILLLAGINYAILSTARSALRFKEIGVRKVLGATRATLRIQILIESVLLTMMALPLALFLLGMIDPRITGLPDYTITMYSSNMLKYILFFTGITLTIGILSGMYVAVYLAGLNPINALKAKYFSPGKFNLSKVFLGFQLFITLSLLICMITIYTQIRFCYVSNLSIARQNILLVPFKKPDFTKYSSMKSKLVRISDITSFSGTGLMNIPSGDMNSVPLNLPNSKKQLQIEWVRIDREFFKTLGIQILQGREFDPYCLARKKIELIINEEGKNGFGIDKPVGLELNHAKIVGVVRDFNIHTLHKKILPTIFIYDPYSVNTLIIHYKQGSENSVISEIQKAWEEVYPGIPFNYSFYQQELKGAYTRENNFVIAVAVFTILAFVITGMGLFGLALLISERKTKETAVRKVFGASNVQIIFRMQKEFLLYTGIATILSIPVSWFLMELWLKEFYYRVNISIWVMLLCILTVTAFVSVILLLRTLKVLRSNPVNALKYE